jgi:transposase InsO family protein
MKTFNSEAIRLKPHREREHARGWMAQFIGQAYNCRRLHPALGHLSPAVYETALP